MGGDNFWKTYLATVKRKNELPEMKLKQILLENQ